MIIQITKYYAIKIAKSINGYFCSLWKKENNEWYPEYKSISLTKEQVDNKVLDFRAIFLALKGAKSTNITQLRERIQDFLLMLPSYVENDELAEQSEALEILLNDLDTYLLLGE